LRTWSRFWRGSIEVCSDPFRSYAKEILVELE
jgi:hypothetical protein